MGCPVLCLTWSTFLCGSRACPGAYRLTMLATGTHSFLLSVFVGFPVWLCVCVHLCGWLQFKAYPVGTATESYSPMESPGIVPMGDCYPWLLLFNFQPRHYVCIGTFVC